MPGPAQVSFFSDLMASMVRLQAVFVTARLGLVDHLAAGTKGADELATATDTDPDALRRLLRFLVVEGLLTVDEQDLFTPTALGASLRRDAPGGLRGQLLRGAARGWPVWGELLHSVRTGRPAYDHLFGKSYFEDLENDPEERQVIARMLAASAAGAAAAIGAACDLGGCRRVVDVGGGEGRLLAALAGAHPQLSGTLFDAPGVVPLARKVLDEAGLGERCEAVAGDFFAGVPSGGDLYLLSWVLHDWDYDRSRTILRNCRTAMGGRGRLVIVETLMADRPSDSPQVVFLDLGMLVHTGGKERTLEEYRRLLADAGLSLERVIPTASARGASLLEAVAAEAA